VVVKDAVLKSHPWIAGALFEAFCAAKDHWLERLKSGEAKTAEDHEYREFRAIVGDDPLPYGVPENLPAIEALVDYSAQQGLIPRRVRVDELFLDPRL
jgi:4,5-dihydroxyphthalate decarboxylase